MSSKLKIGSLVKLRPGPHYNRYIYPTYDIALYLRNNIDEETLRYNSSHAFEDDEVGIVVYATKQSFYIKVLTMNGCGWIYYRHVKVCK